jgi:hypothetical protein
MGPAGALITRRLCAVPSVMERPAGPRSHTGMPSHPCVTHFSPREAPQRRQAVGLRRAPKALLSPSAWHSQGINSCLTLYYAEGCDIGRSIGRTAANMSRRRVSRPSKRTRPLEDPERLVIDPDPRSVTGDSVRIFGYSSRAQEVLTVVVVIDHGQVYGGTAWRANKHELRLYRGGERI